MYGAKQLVESST